MAREDLCNPDLFVVQQADVAETFCDLISWQRIPCACNRQSDKQQTIAVSEDVRDGFLSQRLALRLPLLYTHSPLAAENPFSATLTRRNNQAPDVPLSSRALLRPHPV